MVYLTIVTQTQNNAACAMKLQKKKKKPKNPASTVKTRHASNNMHFPKVAKTVS